MTLIGYELEAPSSLNSRARLTQWCAAVGSAPFSAPSERLVPGCVRSTLLLPVRGSCSRRRCLSVPGGEESLGIPVHLSPGSWSSGRGELRADDT